MGIKRLFKKKKESKPDEIKVEGAREYIELFAEVLILVFFINAFLLQTYVIPSGSMEATMLIGDHLLVDKVAVSRSLGSVDAFLLPQYGISRGRILTFTGPHEIYTNKEPKNLVKRVVALPGDTIRIEGKKVFINGKQVFEPYAVYKGRNPITKFPPSNGFNWDYNFPREYRDFVVKTPGGEAYRVPEGHYFCMGDNRNHSFDSRYWGPLP